MEEEYYDGGQADLAASVLESVLQNADLLTEIIALLNPLQIIR
jgi:hypothetical protein